MSLIGRLFGTDKAVEKAFDTTDRIIDRTASVIDEAFYTDQEKAQELARATTEGRQVLIQWLQSTRGPSLARRLLALSITATWLLMHMTSTVMSVSSVWATDPKKLLAASQIIDTRIDAMTAAVMLILGFYFAAPYMGKVAEQALERFGGKSDGKADTRKAP